MSERVDIERRRRVFSWVCFDFANSAFGALIGTFVYATLFVTSIASDSISGTRIWGLAVAAASLTIGLLSPLLGAIADAYGWKRRLMAGFICLGAASSFALYFPQPGQAILAAVIFAAGTIAVELAIVFNNAFLPELAPKEEQGKVSGWAFAAGYAGGLLCLMLAWVGFVNAESPWFGFSKEAFEHVRAVNLLVGAWVLVFSLPMLLWVKDVRQAKSSSGPSEVARQSFARLGDTLGHIRRYRNIFWLLFARLFYNDGLATAFAFGAIYAAGTFGFSIPEALLLGIVLNVFSGLGALAFSFMDRRIGDRMTILISLVALLFASGAAVFVESRTGFWICAIGVGLFIGPNQSASRAFLSRQAPPEKMNEFFGFFAFSGKATSFAGPLLCGLLTEAFGSQRVGMGVVPVLFAIGLVLMLWKTRSIGKE